MVDRIRSFPPWRRALALLTLAALAADCAAGPVHAVPPPGSAVVDAAASPPDRRAADAGASPRAHAAPREDGPSSGFDWPAGPPAIIVRPFDGPERPWLAGHRGVDLAAPPGTAVRAPAGGVVLFNGVVVDRHVLVIGHGALRSTLEPVASGLAVGTRVRPGEPVGTVTGEPAHAAGTVHWGVRRGEEYLDPALLVRPRPRAVLWR
ncbi:MAG: M23 family metallopeptidase [Bifidobacteriaceae bacterium]|jgi:murein DD-endopeptidase MepM/ murein hydrolase activator NlpD|nr:M23 family metallopeptidase [Bifidobacteriaceae bacterium]